MWRKFQTIIFDQKYKKIKNNLCYNNIIKMNQIIM